MRLNNRRASVALTFILFAGSVWAKEAAPLAEDPVVEAKVMAISKELRCLVCQNQTIADSNAPLALDLRQEVRDMVKKGMGQTEVVSFMEERYGDFVRYRPAFKISTLLLWVGPLLLFVLALSVLYYNLLHKKRKNIDETTPLSPEEQRRVAELLEKETVGDGKV